VIDGGCGLDLGREADGSWSFLKKLQAIGGILEIFGDAGEGGALIVSGLNFHGAVKVLKIILFADATGSSSATGGGARADCGSSAMLGEG
jgi:hypothetical protein